MAVVYQFNSINLNNVENFIENLGLSAEYRTLKKSHVPASGFGKLMQAKINVKNRKNLLDIIKQQGKIYIWAEMPGGIREYHKKQWN